jgi:uncharacterized protein (TIGR03382 family)
MACSHDLGVTAVLPWAAVLLLVMFALAVYFRE